jgi:PAS domain S-box-containing protein
MTPIGFDDQSVGALVESLPDAILVVQQDGRIALLNRQAEEMFGYGREELLNQPVEILIPERLREIHVRSRQEYSAQPRTRPMGSGLDLVGRRKDGTELPVEISLSPLRTGTELLIIAAIRDITERKQAELAIRRLNEELEERVAERTAELAESNRQLVRKNEENETFVYSVSHDLRSPLVNLEGFSKELRLVSQDLREILSKHQLPAPVQERVVDLLDGAMAESIGYIETAVLRLSSIIDALLGLSRAGRVVFNMQWIDMNGLVARIVESLKVTIAEKRAVVTVKDLAPAWGDPTAVGQIFANLIGNALNYLDARRPGQIQMGTLPDSDGQSGRLRTYYVKDNGLGIPAAYAPKVFHAFQRLHPESAQGEGMGLAIVHRIVERHGGRVWVESEVGVGSTFFVALPIPAP